MSAPPATAAAWTCDNCGVSAGRIDGQPTVQPNGWTSSTEGRFCLSCSRTRAGELALENAPPDSTRAERLKIRRAGLIEFEMRRAPDEADGRIASACGTSVSTVAAVRRELEATS